MSSLEELFNLHDAPSTDLINSLTQGIVGNMNVHYMISNLNNMLRTYSPCKNKLLNDLGEEEYAVLWNSRSLKMEQVMNYSEYWSDFILSNFFIENENETHGVPENQRKKIIILTELHDYLIEDRS